MPFEQTRDVIERARQFHRQLAEFYHRVESEVDRERVKMTIEYLAAHEERMERRLAEFETATGRRILDTWYQYPPDDTIRAALAATEIRSDMSVTEAICMALDLDEHLLRLYARAADAAQSAEVRDAFETLLEEGKKERSKLVLDLFEPDL